MREKMREKGSFLFSGFQLSGFPIKKIAAVLFAAMLMLSVAGCSSLHQFESYRPITDLNNLEQRKVGVNIGWAADYLLSSRDDLILYRYDTTADMLMAMCYKQLDAIAIEDIYVKQILACSTGLRMVDGYLTIDGYVALFSKQRADMLDEFDAWVTEYMKTEDYQKWRERVDSFDGVHYEWPGYEWPTEGEHIVVASWDADFPVFCYVNGQEYGGYDAELLYLFCRDCGYAPEIRLMPSDAMIAGLASGAVDMMIGDYSELYAVDARASGILVSEVYRDEPIRVVEIADPDNISISAVSDIEVLN